MMISYAQLRTTLVSDIQNGTGCGGNQQRSLAVNSRGILSQHNSHNPLAGFLTPWHLLEGCQS
jgi:hypothetical protein